MNPLLLSTFIVLFGFGIGHSDRRLEAAEAMNLVSTRLSEATDRLAKCQEIEDMAIQRKLTIESLLVACSQVVDSSYWGAGGIPNAGGLERYPQKLVNEPVNSKSTKKMRTRRPAMAGIDT